LANPTLGVQASLNTEKEKKNRRILIALCLIPTFLSSTPFLPPFLLLLPISP